MIPPKKVFHYSAAATAGYTLTAPVMEWLLSVARWMASIALLSFILALACLYTWITSPDRDRWLALYFLGFCCLSAVMVAPMVIATRMALRCANSNQTEAEKV